MIFVFDKDCLFSVDEELSKPNHEELEYIKMYHGDIKVSEIGKRAALILSRLFGGMHHLSSTQIKKIDWSNPHYISYAHNRSLSTYDSDDLTHLVLFAHHYCVRITVSPLNFNYLEIQFHPRNCREGDFDKRHPTIHEVVKKYKY